MPEALTTQTPREHLLMRNCRLEPVQAPNVDFVVEQCLADTRKAWQRGYPAIVETHRVNFAHFDPLVVKKGQEAFQKYLVSICQDPQELPVFMVDVEIAQLQARGVSWVVRGEKLIIRNGTHSRRMVSIDQVEEFVHKLFNGDIRLDLQ